MLDISLFLTILVILFILKSTILIYTITKATIIFIIRCYLNHKCYD
jgi:hypothetical protein